MRTDIEFAVSCSAWKLTPQPPYPRITNKTIENLLFTILTHEWCFGEKGRCSHGWREGSNIEKKDRQGTVTKVKMEKKLGAESSSVRRRMEASPKPSLRIHKNVRKALGFLLYLKGV